MIEPLLLTKYPILDRNFDFSQEELTTIEGMGRLQEKINYLIGVLNGWQDNLDKREFIDDITNKRKLSPNGNFTGTLMGRTVPSVISEVDNNQDKIRYLTNQFADGYTGKVIDGGFFEDDLIARNYDGGVFR